MSIYLREILYFTTVSLSNKTENKVIKDECRMKIISRPPWLASWLTCWSPPAPGSFSAAAGCWCYMQTSCRETQRGMKGMRRGQRCRITMFWWNIFFLLFLSVLISSAEPYLAPRSAFCLHSTTTVILVSSSLDDSASIEAPGLSHQGW